MIDFLVNILEANINFQNIGAILIIYFAAIWILLCFWVFMDARKRFDKTLIGVAFFFLVLIFNFPGLIFYLIIRPEKNEDHFLYLQNNEVISNNSDKQGVEVPILNFVDENGEVNLSFQLKINKTPVITTSPSGAVVSNPQLLQVNVDVPTTTSMASEIKPTALKAENSEVQVIQTSNAEDGFKVKFSSIKDKFNQLKSTNTSSNPVQVKSVEVKEVSSSKTQENSSKKKLFSRKKKRRR